MTTDRRASRAEPLKNSYRFLALAVVLTVPFLLLACPSAPNKPSETPPPTSPAKSDFDGDRAFELVRKQVEFGSRPAGSAELEQTRNFMIDQLRSYGLTVTTDEFRATTPIGERKMVNVTAELPGESNNVVIISSHYDTKYFKDFKFVGANDAGSSTGALMEIARVMAASKQKPKMTYWFVFFDGEEAFCKEWDDCHNPNPADPKTPLPDHTYGSRRYVAQLIGKNELSRVRAMILLDMIGYKSLRLGRADLGTGWLTDIVWQTARQLGYGNVFIDSMEGVGDDDHGPFLQAGVDAIDIIQLSTYPYWHTKEDTLDKISAKSLKTVGDAVLVSLPKIEERLSKSSR
jgi:hypothetical protein